VRLRATTWHRSRGGGDRTGAGGGSGPAPTTTKPSNYLPSFITKQYRWRALANITHNIPATGSRLTTANNGGVATLTGHNTIRGRAMRGARTFR
jgi:hypothetical protein